jgi:hypothetical protein
MRTVSEGSTRRTVAPKESSLLRWTRGKVMDAFGADLRSLAALRIVLALLVLGDLVTRATSLVALHTDEGVLPRTAVLEEALSSWRFSLNLANGEPVFQVFLFGVTALAALGMLVGYRTRLMTVIVWVLLLSIQYRNPLTLSGGDSLLRLLLFWSMFLPLGAYWSVDRALNATPPRLSTRFLSFATVGLFMQIAFMYWFTAILKWQGGPEWRDGSALYYALNVDRFHTPIGVYVSHLPGDLLMAITIATLALEALGPFLLFSPFFTTPARMVAVMSFMSLHFGIFLTMYIGIFPWVSALCMVCFLPAWFWDKAAAEFRAVFPERPDLVRRLGSMVGRNPIHSYLSPLRVQMSSVAGRAGSVSEPGSPPPSGNTQPAVEASNESVDDGAVSGSQQIRLRSSLATNLIAVFFLLYVLCLNLTTVSDFSMSESAESPAYFLGLVQRWVMFAPPPTSGGWHVIPGSLRDGRQVDLLPVTRGDFSLHEVSWEKPPYAGALYESHHWRKYMSNIVSDDYEDLRPYFGSYICREWNARHEGPEELTTLQVVYMVEETLPDNQRSTPQKVDVWEQDCL